MLTIETEFLSPGEVKDLTGKARPDDQETELRGQGIPHRRRGNRILVSRHHTREWLSGRVVTPSRGVRLDLVK